MCFLGIDCSNMSRLAMSCFAATKYGGEKGEKNSTKEKSFERLPLTPVKYNGKMMNSIWGEYNKKSPHNFKKQNAEQLVAERNQESIDTLTSTYIFSLPNFPNFQVETHFEMKKNRPSLERMESLFNFPIFS